MTKMNQWVIPLLLTVVFLSGCENASDTVINIPNVQVGCTTTDSTDCSSTNTNPIRAYVVMTRSSCSAANFDPVATGDILMSCDVAGCEGVVSSWINPNNSESLSEILTGSMDICTTVDLDNSGSSLATTGDLENQTTRSIQSNSTLTIDEDWEVTQ